MTSPACRPDTQQHRDATALVEYLMAHNGSVTETQESIAAGVGMWRVIARGMQQADVSRFRRALNHIRDEHRASDGKLCCGYQLHYRGGTPSVLQLADPTGDLGPYAGVVIASHLGYLQRLKQQKTENRRQVATFEALEGHVRARGDRDGARLLMRCSVEVERDGMLTDPTMAELQVWLDTL